MQETRNLGHSRLVPGAVPEGGSRPQLHVRPLAAGRQPACGGGSRMNLEMISRYPVEEKSATPLLFIHGMMCTASSWDAHFLDYFARNGFAAHAVNLRGHGKSEGRQKLRWARIADFVR